MVRSDRPAERHKEGGRILTDRVRGTQSCKAPSPVAGWTARDVARHLTEWFPSFLAVGAGVHLRQVRASTTSRSARGWRSAAPCRPCWRVRRPPAGVPSNPPTGAMPLDRGSDRSYPCVVAERPWDAVRGTRLDPV